MIYATGDLINFLEGNFATAQVGRDNFVAAASQAVSDLSPCDSEWPSVSSDVPATDETIMRQDNGVELGTGNEIRAKVAGIQAILAKAQAV